MRRGWGEGRGRGAERRRERERKKDPHTNSEEKSIQIPESLTFNTVAFVFLTWENEEKINLRKTRGVGE